MIWTIGEVKIVSIVEQALNELDVVIPSATPEVLKPFKWLTPYYADENGVMSGIIQAFIIDTGDTRIVVDTCVGDDRDRKMIAEWHRQQRHTLDKFQEAGYPPESIDWVLCTHLHVDHVGWNTYYDGTAFVPTFPNARYLFARTEFEYWQSETKKDLTAPDPNDHLAGLLAAFNEMMQCSFADSVQPVLDAGLVDLVELDHKVCDGVRLIPSPGHTPGHVSVEINSKEQRAVITGDAIHHPCQIARPELGTVIDESAEVAVDSRREMLGAAVKDGSLIIGSHFSEPSGGTVSADGAGFRLHPEGHAK